jgi:hypothetical protein
MRVRTMKAFTAIVTLNVLTVINFAVALSSYLGIVRNGRYLSLAIFILVMILVAICEYLAVVEQRFDKEFSFLLIATLTANIFILIASFS